MSPSELFSFQRSFTFFLYHYVDVNFLIFSYFHQLFRN